MTVGSGTDVRLTHTECRLLAFCQQARSFDEIKDWPLVVRAHLLQLGLLVKHSDYPPASRSHGAAEMYHTRRDLPPSVAQQVEQSGQLWRRLLLGS